MWDACHGVGLRGTYATLLKATPLLIETAQKYDTRPLACLISSFGGQAYTFNVAYGVGKAATDRLARDASAQLSKHDVDTISLYPGVVATEGNLEMESGASGPPRRVAWICRRPRLLDSRGGLSSHCCNDRSTAPKTRARIRSCPSWRRSLISRMWMGGGRPRFDLYNISCRTSC